MLYKYFSENKMYDKKNKKQIIPNENIRKIFGMKENENINFYNVQTWLKKDTTTTR